MREHHVGAVHPRARYVRFLAPTLPKLITPGPVVQALGQEGIIPFSKFFASNKPFGAPLAGLFEQWFVTSSLVLTVPPGDAYLFMINSTSLPSHPSVRKPSDHPFAFAQ